MTTPDVLTTAYLEVVHQLLAEDQRHTDALEAAHRAGQTQVTDALAAQRRVNDLVNALTDRVRRLDGQVDTAVLRAGSPEVTAEIHAGVALQSLRSVDDVARAVEAIEKDLVTLRSALDWLDRNPAAPRPALAPPSPLAVAQPPSTPAVRSAAPETATPSGASRSAWTWVGLIGLIIALAILGFVVL